ncbi:biogenesis of lysosome-related organelles complex 1 subunit 6-like [Choristoneura fumiferana]|uniref:biogenesis of lysosome-related organelles complex 1 subunit 6-like n=1 Tax=Choristoneura fumiferana TaxID=7141 RepID=UPI003D159075
MEGVNQTDDAKTIQLLSKGIMELYEPPLATINTHLKELTERQEAVHSMLVSERRKLEDLQNDAMVDALLADIATNKEKLVSISNSMMGLHKRVQLLQGRAANVEKAAKNRVSTQICTFVGKMILTYICYLPFIEINNICTLLS